MGIYGGWGMQPLGRPVLLWVSSPLSPALGDPIPEAKKGLKCRGCLA